MYLLVLKNRSLPDLYKVGVTKNIDTAVQQLNRYVPEDFEVVWSCLVSDRRVFDIVRQMFPEGNETAHYLKNGYFRVTDFQTWMAQIKMQAMLVAAPEPGTSELSSIMFTSTARAFAPLEDTSSPTVTYSTDSPIRYMSRTEAANQLGVNPKTLSRWEQSGAIDVPRTPSGRPAYTEGVMRQLKPSNQPEPSDDNAEEDYL